MIYKVSWIEKRRRQRVFFYSLGHAKYFAQRLGRAAIRIDFFKARIRSSGCIITCKLRFLIGKVD
jgi:hypothetical protein